MLRNKRFQRPALVIMVAVIGLWQGVVAAGEKDRQERDFGLHVQQLLDMQSNKLFGVKRPLLQSSDPSVGAYRMPQQLASEQLVLAKGLQVQYLTRNAANKTDMVAFWPQAENATHLISCVEGGREIIGSNEDGSDKYNPAVQRIELNSGKVETVLRGMSRCDGIRVTAWGTILATEEASDGAAYEILDPLAMSNELVINRATGEVSKPAMIAKREALPIMAWEGLTVLPSGVVIAGDELRPGTGIDDKDGGAIFKFVPDTPWNGSPIEDLNDSPLVFGASYAMQVSCRDSRQQYGQGCEIGNAAWISINPATARDDADALGATGYYRPEDLHRDSLYQGEGVRFCWANTGNKGASNYGEIVCGVDHAPMVADAEQRSVVVNRFIEGDADLNAPDNLAFQPGTGNLYVIEDNPNGDIFACLRDGRDRDIKSDGCIKILSVKDSSAEPTGFMFSADGKTAYLSIQHSDDSAMSDHDGYPTDDILVISGFAIN